MAFKSPDPTQPERENRTQYLDEMLKFKTTDQDLVPMVREVARVIGLLNADVMELRNQMAITQKLLLEFMEDNLTFRQKRNEEDLHIAQEKIQRAQADVDRTSQKIKAIKLSGDTGVPLPPVKPFSGSWWKIWFAERVLPYVVYALIGGVAILLGNALWSYFKTQLGVP